MCECNVSFDEDVFVEPKGDHFYDLILPFGSLLCKMARAPKLNLKWRLHPPRQKSFKWSMTRNRMAERSRQWTWTLFNYTDEDITRIQGLESVTYLCFGKEVAPSTGRAHLQGFVCFANAKSRKRVIEMIHPEVSLEKTRGTAAQNREYCQKDGDFWETGDLPAQGARTDLKEIQEMIENGCSDLQIAKDYFGQWCRMRSSFSAYRNLVIAKRVRVSYEIESFPESWRNIEMKDTNILWGESGIGKTQFVKALVPNILMVSHIDELLTFKPELYDGILFDDMSFTHLPRTAQIHLVDSDDDRAIHCRYNVAHIPAGTRKFFTTNEFEGRIFDIDDGAIARRVNIVRLEAWQ